LGGLRVECRCLCACRKALGPPITRASRRMKPRTRPPIRCTRAHGRGSCEDRSALQYLPRATRRLEARPECGLGRGAAVLQAAVRDGGGVVSPCPSRGPARRRPIPRLVARIAVHAACGVDDRRYSQQPCVPRSVCGSAITASTRLETGRWRSISRWPRCRGQLVRGVATDNAGKDGAVGAAAHHQGQRRGALHRHRPRRAPLGTDELACSIMNQAQPRSDVAFRLPSVPRSRSPCSGAARGWRRQRRG
jgi:hypothetical protein